MHVMLSELPRAKAVSVNFLAAASGSSSILTSETASCSVENGPIITKSSNEQDSNTAYSNATAL